MNKQLQRIMDDIRSDLDSLASEISEFLRDTNLYCGALDEFYCTLSGKPGEKERCIDDLTTLLQDLEFYLEDRALHKGFQFAIRGELDLSGTELNRIFDWRDITETEEVREHERAIDNQLKSYAAQYNGKQLMYIQNYSRLYKEDIRNECLVYFLVGYLVYAIINNDSLATNSDDPKSIALFTKICSSIYSNANKKQGKDKTKQNHSTHSCDRSRGS